MSILATSFRQLINSARFAGLIYGVTLGLGLLIALPFYNTLLVEDQNSRAFLKLLDGFNYTIYSDFMHRSGRVISPLLSVGRWLGALYVLLSIFFTGGILMLFSARGQRVSRVEFLTACSTYVGRYLRLLGVVLLFVLAGAVSWLVLGTLVGILLNDALTERGLFWIGTVFFGLFGLSATLILCIGDYAKILLFRTDEQRAFRAFGRAGRFVLSNLGRTYALYWLFIGIGTALFGLYFLLDELIMMQNWLTILLLSVIQQTLVFGRVGLKIWWLGTAALVYDSLPKQDTLFATTPVLVQPLFPTELDKDGLDA